MINGSGETFDVRRLCHILGLRIAVMLFQF